MAVGVAGHDGDRRADVSLGQRVAAAGGAADVDSVALPLVVDRAQSVFVSQGIGCGERLVFGWCSADRDRTGRRVVDVGDWSDARAGDAFIGALAVGVTGYDGDRGADVGLGERVAAAGGAADVDTVALPLVVDRAQTVFVSQDVGCGEGLVFGRCAADGDRTGRRVVDVGDWTDARAGHAFAGALAVGVTGDDGDRGADVGLGQRVAAAVGSADVDPVALPLVADRAQTVFVGQGVGCGEGLVFGRCAADGDRTGRRVVDVGDWTDARAGDAFAGALAVGVTGYDGDRGADVGLGQRVAAAGGAADVDTVALPLVADRAQTVFVGQGVGCGEGLVFGRCAADGDCAGRRVVDVGHRSDARAGDAFAGALAVGVAGYDRDGGADVGLGQRVAAAGGAADVNSVALPLVTDRAQSVFIGQGIGCGEGLVLGRCAADGDCAGRRVVDVGHWTDACAGHAFAGALAVGVAGYDRDGGADVGLGQGVAAAGGSADVNAVPLPLVVDRAQTVFVRQGIGCGERLVFGRCSADGD